ncbi:hypothetical protein [Borreliella bavariensis]|nr:hypothetical protein [Borreliella bavariensis]
MQRCSQALDALKILNLGKEYSNLNNMLKKLLLIMAKKIYKMQ